MHISSFIYFHMLYVHVNGVIAYCYFIEQLPLPSLLFNLCKQLHLILNMSGVVHYTLQVKHIVILLLYITVWCLYMLLQGTSERCPR